MKWISGVMVAVLLCVGCGGPEPVDILEPDGRFGVMVVERGFRVRLDQVVDAQIYLPTVEVGEVAPGPHRVVLFIQGGLVEPVQYGWLAEHLARRGYLVVMPEHVLDLAIFSIGHGAEVVEALDRASRRSGDFFEGLVDEAPAVVMGHSLGGVIAVKTWLDRPERFAHVVMLQSIPDSADAARLAERRFEPGEVFAVAGERDGRITVEEIQAELTLFADPVLLAVVEGLNHYQLLDSPTAGQQASDWPATVDREVGRGRLLALLDLFMEFVEDPDEDAVLVPSSWPDGVVEDSEVAQ